MTIEEFGVDPALKARGSVEMDYEQVECMRFCLLFCFTIKAIYKRTSGTGSGGKGNGREVEAIWI